MKLSKNMNILIVGLGLLGGSYAMALKKQGYTVSAITLEQADIDYALQNKMIDFGCTAVSERNVGNADIVVFALYPNTFIQWIKNHAYLFKKGTIITDVTGVKERVVYEVQAALPENVEFIAAHPMAGKAVSGIKNSDDAIFKNANYIVVPTENNTTDGIELCRDLGNVLGFKKVSTLTPREHDEMIAFLSQLTHCIAVSLMCAGEKEGLESYTGDSFRDLTRIAKINDEMWSELFLLNRDALLMVMDQFKAEFDELYTAIKQGDREKMREKMRKSAQRRTRFDRDSAQ